MKLLVFAPCERALVEQGNNGVSLISVLQNLTVTLSGDSVPAESAALDSFQWYAVAMWRREDGDEGKRFQQRVTLLSPAGAVMLRAVAEFELLKAFHRVISRIQAFPMAEGTYTLELAVRDTAGLDEHEWNLVSSYPIGVTHRTKPTSQPTAH